MSHEALTLPDAELARWIKLEAALVASSLDQTQAVELARVLCTADVEGRIEVRPKPPIEVAESGFVGLLMAARFGGRCHVCGEDIRAGETIFYSRSLKKAAHERCGVSE